MFSVRATVGDNCLLVSDIHGVDYRIATIAGPPDCCARARKMVQDIVAEVSWIFASLFQLIDC